MDNDSDILLVRRLKQGDQRAFNQIVNRYQQRLYYLALRMVNNHEDAADISQDAFVKAYEGLSKFHENSSLYTWLYRIVINSAINHQRKKKLWAFMHLDDMKSLSVSPSGSPDKVLERNELAEAVDKAIQELPEKQKAIFVLRYYENLSHREIAEIVGRSVGAVKASYFHAVNKLRKALARFVE